MEVSCVDLRSGASLTHVHPPAFRLVPHQLDFLESGVPSKFPALNPKSQPLSAGAGVAVRQTGKLQCTAAQAGVRVALCSLGAFWGLGSLGFA